MEIGTEISQKVKVSKDGLFFFNVKHVTNLFVMFCFKYKYIACIIFYILLLL